jgi:tRNA(fMet)-specific endonuclease VapC
VILDTSFLVDVLRGEDATEEWVVRLEEEAFGVVTAISGMELWEGIQLADASEAEREGVEALLTGIHHADFDDSAAMRAGAMNAELTRTGEVVQVEDVMIDAIAAER